MDECRTIPELLQRRVLLDGDRPALHVKRDGRFQALTWGDVYREVVRAASMLVDCGVGAGDRVAQLSENRLEWIVIDLAVQSLGAIHVPVHAPLTSQQVAYQVNDCQAKVVCLSSQVQVDKIVAAADTLRCQPRCFVFDDVDPPPTSVEITRFTAAVDDLSTNRADDLPVRAQQISPASVATILYTSGTTGEPKGVVLTQENVTSNALGAIHAFTYVRDDRRMNFLPLSHIFARTCDLYTWLAVGHEMILAESRETIIADCQQTHPTLLNGVPYFFDKVYRALCEQGMQDQPGVVRGILGGAMRFCCSGGAPLPGHLFDFFRQQEVPVLEGYGLTESSPVITLSTEQHAKRGSAGKPIDRVEVRIAEDGEILTRGPHVMQGYYLREAETQEAIRDGWLYTGDLGHLDEDGFLFITGRKKELIITAAGKNIAPTALESLLTQDPLITQAIVVGDNRSYLVALIVPDPAGMQHALDARGIDVPMNELLSSAEVRQIYEEAIAHQLKSVSHHEQVRKFVLLDRPFTIERGELTAKLSLRREQIAHNHADVIAGMYAD